MSIVSRTIRVSRVSRVVRGAALAVAATGLLALTQLDPSGATTTTRATAGPLDTTALLSGLDVGYLGSDLGELNRQVTDLYGARRISACTGTAGFDSVTGDRDLTSLGSRWTNADGQSPTVLTEAIAQASSPAAARRDARRTVTALRACQHRGGSWHYGTAYHTPLVDGDHVWLDRLDRDGNATGGVAVMLQGDRFGVVEVIGSVADGDDAIKNVVLPAEDRLAG